jgi:hypothetical protein
MEMEKKGKGRPRQATNTIPFWQFLRGAAAMCAYDEARERGEKHSVAVGQAADFVRKVHPQMPISETEVKRVLATWRPRGSSTILRLERSSPSEEDVIRHRWLREELTTLNEKKALKLPIPQKEITTRIIVRLGERPDYPRHNRKIR